MSLSFKGFNEKGQPEPGDSNNSDDSDSNTGLSEYESPVTSTESSPVSTSAAGSRSTTPSRESIQNSGRVKKLAEYFSSDSDTTTADQHRPTTRRRKSNTLEHQQLPLGGERELRRRMANQSRADAAVNLWQALLVNLKAALDEADQDLDQNKSRGVLLGHAAEIEASHESVQTAWETVNTFLQDTTVTLSVVDLQVKSSKYKARCAKVLAHLMAQTDVPTPTPTPTATSVHLIKPTTFGDLDLEKFSGDYTAFDSFEGNFRGLINNGNLDDGGKKAYLLKSLEDDAKEFIGTEGLAAKTYEDIWTELRGRYGKPWRITRAAVKKLMDIKDPSDSPKDISRYWNEITQVCKVVERRKLTASSLILNMALLKLPVEFRAKMDDKLRPLSPEYILSREMVAEPFNDVIAGELEKPTNIVATLGFNTIPQVATNIPKKSSYGSRKANSFMCLLCNKGKTSKHKTWQCPVYTTGPMAQDRMKALGRCQYCATVLTEHGQECSHRAHCRSHPNQRHNFWLCTSFVNSANKVTQYQYPPQHQTQQHQYPQQQHQQSNPYSYNHPYPQQAGSSSFGQNQP